MNVEKSPLVQKIIEKLQNDEKSKDQFTITFNNGSLHYHRKNHSKDSDKPTLFANKIKIILLQYEEEVVNKENKNETDPGRKRFERLKEFHTKNSQTEDYQHSLLNEIQDISQKSTGFFNKLENSDLIISILNTVQDENDFAFYFDHENEFVFCKKFHQSINSYDAQVNNLYDILCTYDMNNNDKSRFTITKKTNILSSLNIFDKNNSFRNGREEEPDLKRAAMFLKIKRSEQKS